MKNAFVNSDGVFVELYEGPLWLSVHANKGVLPSRKTIGQWADQFHERRLRTTDAAGDPFPRTYRHVFNGAPAGPVYYFDPSVCRTAGTAFGTIVVDR